MGQGNAREDLCDQTPAAGDPGSLTDSRYRLLPPAPDSGRPGGHLRGGERGARGGRVHPPGDGAGPAHLYPVLHLALAGHAGGFRHLDRLPHGCGVDHPAAPPGDADPRLPFHDAGPSPRRPCGHPGLRPTRTATKTTFSPFLPFWGFPFPGSGWR